VESYHAFQVSTYGIRLSGTRRPRQPLETLGNAAEPLNYHHHMKQKISGFPFYLDGQSVAGNVLEGGASVSHKSSRTHYLVLHPTQAPRSNIQCVNSTAYHRLKGSANHAAQELQLQTQSGFLTRLLVVKAARHYRHNL
jgi:hypothetical protein